MTATKLAIGAGRRSLLGCVLALALFGCAESTATNESEDPWSTKSADPEFVRRAESHDTSADNPNRPCESCGISHAMHCELMPGRCEP